MDYTQTVRHRAMRLLQAGRWVTPAYAAAVCDRDDMRGVHRVRDGRPRLYLASRPVRPGWKRMM